MVQDWLARWKNNPSLVSDMAMYLLSTLLSLELRGVVLCDGPTNAMVRSLNSYARVVFGDVAGWSLYKKPRHRTVVLVVSSTSFGLTASAGGSGAHLGRSQRHRGHLLTCSWGADAKICLCTSQLSNSGRKAANPNRCRPSWRNKMCPKNRGCWTHWRAKEPN